jgi:hypothetical protein
LLKASILKVDVGDLELDEDELAADMAANAPQANPDFEDLMQQNGLNREQQQQQQGQAGAAGDVEMQDVQQENVPPAGNSQQQQQSSQGGEKQQGTQGEKQQEAAGTQQQTQPRKTSTISAEKYEFVKVGYRRQACAVCAHQSVQDTSRALPANVGPTQQANQPDCVSIPAA